MPEPSFAWIKRFIILSMSGMYTGTSTVLSLSVVWSLPAPILAQSLPAVPPTPPTLTPPPPPQILPRPIENLNLGPAEEFRQYRLGPGDQIFVQVQRHSDLNFSGAITSEGKIVMPVIGTVFLEGLTLEQAQATIRAQLNQYYINPIVSVELLVQRPVVVTVTGEVARPGFYALPADSNRLFTALTLAGGVNPASDLRGVQVRRTLGNGTVVEQRLDLFTPLATGTELPNLRLADGDVVIVPQQDISGALGYDSEIVANSTLASQRPVQVTVTGEVARPGFYPLQPGTTRISDALLIAGGATAASDLAQVQIRRVLEDGSVIEQTVDLLTPLETGAPLPAFQLAQGDTVIVPKRAVSAQDDASEIIARSTLASQVPIQVTITGEVAKPGFYVLPTGITRISEALLTAGGITQTADLREIRIRRSLGDGRYSEESLDLYTPLQTSSNLPDIRLASGDAILVPKLEVGRDQAYDQSLISRSSLAKPTIKIRILSYASGAASTVTLPNGSTFTDALTNVPIDRANLRKIALIRFDPEQGKAVTLEIDGKAAFRGDPAQNPLLQENDVIVIGRNFVARISYALNTFTQPFRDVLGFLLFFDSLQRSADNLFRFPGSDR
jgi:protein involved in polysaccharide export with SLBB domain